MPLRFNSMVSLVVTQVEEVNILPILVLRSSTEIDNLLFFLLIKTMHGCRQDFSEERA